MSAHGRLQVAAGIMGQALAGIAIQNEADFGCDFEIDAAEERVWARVTLESGDVYEISARWVAEKSP